MTGQTIDSADGPYFQTTINGKNGCYGFDNPTSILKKVFITVQTHIKK